MPPRHGERRLQLRRTEFCERHGCPALPAPCIRHRCEGIRGNLTFQRLFVGRELEVCSATVGRERRVDAGHFERGAVEMRRLRCTFECKCEAAEFGGTWHRSYPPVLRALPLRKCSSRRGRISTKLHGRYR